MKTPDLFRLLLPALFSLACSGCTSLGYYGQLAQGQLALLAKRVPVQQQIADPNTDALSRRKLILSQQARDFASASLGLPENRSYRLYVQLDRPYVVWNLFATEEFSVEPVAHCFPIAGCVAYQGFYHEQAARHAAARLAQRGKDTYVDGVDAYSTLGWFADPLLSSMLTWPDERLVSLIFHELAHQKFYVKGDTTFNESYATFVEREGLRQWQAVHGQASSSRDRIAQRDGFTALILDSRERLQKLYAEGLPAPQMRQRKAAEFARLRQDYRRWQTQNWPDAPAYAAWIQGPLNNAWLLPFGLYDRWVDAFAQLFENSDRRWPAFYDAVRRLGKLPAAPREARLQQLAQQAATRQTRLAGPRLGQRP